MSKNKTRKMRKSKKTLERDIKKHQKNCKICNEVDK